MVWLPDGEESLTIRLAVSTEYQRQTDICRQHNQRYAQHRAVKTEQLSAMAGTVLGIQVRQLLLTLRLQDTYTRFS